VYFLLKRSLAPRAVAELLLVRRDRSCLTISP
jgi:hypothetical protein